MLLANILLSLVWIALSGELSLSNLAIGYVVGYAVLWMLVAGGLLPERYRGKVPQFLALLGFLVYELVLANLRMAVDVVRPTRHLRPGIVKVPLDATSEDEILMLAALINLTPGSVALDVTADRRTMYVHAMHVTSADDYRRAVKDGFERRVIRLMR